MSKRTDKIIALLRAPGFDALAVVNAAIKSQWGSIGHTSVFVAGSAKPVIPTYAGGEPWIDFALDELRAGSFFRVTYSVGLFPSGKPRDITCSAPSGLRLSSYGYTPGVMAPAATA